MLSEAGWQKGGWGMGGEGVWLFFFKDFCLVSVLLVWKPWLWWARQVDIGKEAA